MRPKRDWEELVRAKLAGLAVEPREKCEVIEELAAHLQELYESLRTKGLPEQAAMQQTLAQVADWKDLRRRIQIARTKENIMNDRIRQLWLPGFLTFVMSSGILALLQIFGPKPWIVGLKGVTPVGELYIPWLVLLPLIGAMGAYFSSRAGGSQRVVFFSIVFPVLPFLASILVVLPVSLVFDRFIGHNTAPMSLIMALFGWVLAPGAALLAGGLLAKIFLARGLGPRRIAGG